MMLSSNINLEPVRLTDRIRFYLDSMGLPLLVYLSLSPPSRRTLIMITLLNHPEAQLNTPNPPESRRVGRRKPMEISERLRVLNIRRPLVKHLNSRR